MVAGVGSCSDWSLGRSRQKRIVWFVPDSPNRKTVVESVPGLRSTATCVPENPSSVELPQRPLLFKVAADAPRGGGELLNDHGDGEALLEAGAWQRRTTNMRCVTHGDFPCLPQCSGNLLPIRRWLMTAPPGIRDGIDLT